MIIDAFLVMIGLTGFTAGLFMIVTSFFPIDRDEEPKL